MRDNTPAAFTNPRRLDPDMVRVSHARRFAVRYHGDQKYGIRPYVYHLDMVADLLVPYGIEARILGYLHDLREDTAVWPRQIYLEFGLPMLEYCELLKDPGGETRAEKKEALHARLARVKESHFLALIAKVADRLANVRVSVADECADKLEMYRREHAEFRHAVYRPGLCDPLWIQLDELIA